MANEQGNGEDAPGHDEKAEFLGQKKEERQTPDATDSGSDQLLRLTAEFDNYKKRTMKEKDELANRAEAKFMLRMLPVYEEIKLAENESAKIRDEQVRKGVLMVLSKLRASFEKEGLSEMELEGKKFDPYLHETAMREDSDTPEGTIVHVIRKGYLFRGEVLRHALVSISSGKAHGATDGEGKEGGEDGEAKAKKEG